MVKTTRTAVMRGKENLTIEERVLPEMGENDVLVQVKACNICTSEYGVYNGARTRPAPLVFGHEWAGKVLAVGQKVMDIKEGDLVACGYQFDPYSPESLEGRTSECRNILSADILNPDGYYGNAGFAEYAVMSQIALYKIGQDTDPAIAGLLEPVATVVSGIRRMNVRPSDTVVVIGAGTMGLLNALVLREYGCRVIVTELLEKKLKTARELGLEVVDSAAVDAVAEVKRLTNEKGADAVVLAVSAQKATDQAFDMMKKNRGKLLLFAAGSPSPVIKLDVNTLHYRKIEIYGTYGADHVDFAEAARLINKGMDFSAIIEARYPFNEMENAMKAACVPGAYRIAVTM